MGNAYRRGWGLAALSFGTALFFAACDSDPSQWAEQSSALGMDASEPPDAPKDDFGSYKDASTYYEDASTGDGYKDASTDHEDASTDYEDAAPGDGDEDGGPDGGGPPPPPPPPPQRFCLSPYECGIIGGNPTAPSYRTCNSNADCNPRAFHCAGLNQCAQGAPGPTQRPCISWTDCIGRCNFAGGSCDLDGTSPHYCHSFGTCPTKHCDGVGSCVAGAPQGNQRGCENNQECPARHCDGVNSCVAGLPTQTQKSCTANADCEGKCSGNRQCDLDIWTVPTLGVISWAWSCLNNQRCEKFCQPGSGMCEHTSPFGTDFQPKTPCNSATDCRRNRCDVRNATCSPTGTGAFCTSSTNCLTNRCEHNACVPGGRGVFCSAVADCRSVGTRCSGTACITGGTGPSCARDADCNALRSCAGNACIAGFHSVKSCERNEDCDKQVKYCHVDPDNGRATCRANQRSGVPSECNADSDCQIKRCTFIQGRAPACLPAQPFNLQDGLPCDRDGDCRGDVRHCDNQPLCTREYRTAATCANNGDCGHLECINQVCRLKAGPGIDSALCAGLADGNPCQRIVAARPGEPGDTATLVAAQAPELSSEQLATAREVSTRLSRLDANRGFVGKQTAPLTIVVFQDMKCHMAQRAVDTLLEPLERDYLANGKVKLVFAEFPLFGNDSVEARLAAAALCAQDEERYVEFIKAVYNDIDQSTAASIPAYAFQAGILTESFFACVRANRYLDQVARDIELGKEIGVRGTPHFFIGGHSFPGAQPYEDLKGAIDQMLKASSRPRAKTARPQNDENP